MGKVLIYSPGVFANYGHSFDYTCGLISAYLKEQKQVCLIGFEDVLLDDFKKKFPKVKIFPCSYDNQIISQTSSITRLYRGFSRIRNSFRLLRILQDYIKKEADNIDYILFETFDYISLALVIRSLKVRVKTIFHDTNFNFKQSNYLAGIYKFSVRYFVRIILKNSDVCFVHGEDMRKNMIKIFGSYFSSKIISMPYGATYDEKLHDVNQIECLKELELSSNNKYLLVFGTLRKDKIYAPVFEFLKHSDIWKCIIAGPEGDMSNDELDEMIRRSCGTSKVYRFNNFISQKDQIYYFGASDLVVNFYEPYIRHESGTAKLARSYGKALIVYGPNDLLNYVRQNRIGWYIEENDSIVPSINIICDSYCNLTDTEYQNLMVQIRVCSQKYSWNNVVKIING